MNERIEKLARQVEAAYIPRYDMWQMDSETVEKFAKLLIEDVLNEVKERAYYTGERDWSDEVDRPWIQLEFGYGSLADAQKGIFK
jgi:ABC-type taurine transport system substrate-binding protein